MNWQLKYAIENIMKAYPAASVLPVGDNAIRITIPERPEVVAVISADYLINAQLAVQYHQAFPEMDILCGYRKECAWAGEAIRYLESNNIGWGNAGTLFSAIGAGEANTAVHKVYFFSYRLIRQMTSITHLEREFDRVFVMTLRNGQNYRVGMIMEYEPTVDVIRTFWDRFGPINIAWSINPNGQPTQGAIEAGAELGCEVMQWEQLRLFLHNP